MSRDDPPRSSAAFGSTSPELAARAPIATPRSAPLRFLAWSFVLAIAGVPLGQAIGEAARGGPVQVLDYLAPFEQGPGGRTLPAWTKQLALDLASEPRLRDFEQRLREASFVKTRLLPWYQLAATGALRFGNKKVVVGRDGWLFYADDLGSTFGRGYLEPGAGGQEALAAIADFKAQLDERGVKLLLIPSYSKEMLDPRQISRWTDGLASAANPDLPAFYAELERRGLDFVRMDELLQELRRTGGPLALPRDTHWSPATMAHCARAIAERARRLLGRAPGGESTRFTTRPLAIEGGGDLLRMLGLPASQTLYPPMRLALEQVVDRASGAPVRADARSEVLLMGDSLTRVFSDPALGLGEGAGLGEHLALRLDEPIDVIALAGGSATATREALARRPDGLAGKKLVIWQFGVRMLAQGAKEWRLVELPPAIGNPFGAPPPIDVDDVPSDRVTVVGRIVETTTIPPNYDYDFALAVYEYEVVEVVDGELDATRHVWVAFPARDQGKDLPARFFQVGAKQRLTLDDLRLHFDVEQVPLFDDTRAGRVIRYPLKWEEAR